MTALLKPAILIVSDTAAIDHEADRTGPALSRLLIGVESSAGARAWADPTVAIVPDAIDQIQARIKAWTDGTGDERVNLVVTSGGTGFSAADHTPEAVEPLLERQAPGLVHAMLAASLQITPYAMMSRPVAGIRANTVIVTLPGSTKGALENLEAIIRCLPHACLQAAGENSRQTHAGGVKQLEAQSGVSITQGTANAIARGTKGPIQLHTANLSGQAGSSSDHATPDDKPSPRHSHSPSASRPVLPNASRPSSAIAMHRSPSREKATRDDHENTAAILETHSCRHEHGCGMGHGHATPRRHTTAAQQHPRSNDPAAGPTGRSRESPYPMISVDEALDIVSRHTPKPRVVELPVNESLVGFALAEEVYAAESVPAYCASIVDGYAMVVPKLLSDNVRTKGEYPVVSVSHAEAGAALPLLRTGEVARVTTGAPIPDGATAVVMVEDTALVSKTADGKEEAVIAVLTDNIRFGENVREPGSDVEYGAPVLKQREVITSHGGEIGLLASTGVQTVRCYAKPIIGVLSTGDELVRHDDPVESLRYGQIRDSNRPSLLSSLKAQGYPVVDLGIARDTPTGRLEESLRAAMRGSLDSPGVDVIITTGGVSMGELDLLKPTVERSLGGTIHFGRVAMKPGKPTTFATIPCRSAASNTRETRLLFGLPGNPASALVTLNLFVLPCLQQMSGIPPPWGLPRVSAFLDQQIVPDAKRREYHRAHIGVGRDGVLRATSTGGQRSSRVGSLKGANGLLIIEPGSEALRKGDRVVALLLGVVTGR